MLTPHTQTPIVSQAPMRPDLLQSLQVLTQFAVHCVRQNLGVLAINNVALSVEKPSRNFVLGRILDDRDDTLEFFGGDFAGAVAC